MGLSLKKTSTKILASVGLVATAAAVAGMGTYGAFTSSTAASASVASGTVNITLGAAHVRELIDRFGGQVPLALAGYNAGPNAVPRWLPAAPMDSDVWIENIPYDETREYVQRILWHRLMFRWLADESRGEQTGFWLAPITALHSASSDVRLAGSE